MFAGCTDDVVAFVEMRRKEAARRGIGITQQAAGKVVDGDGLQVLRGGDDQLSPDDRVDTDRFCFYLFVAGGDACTQEVAAVCVGGYRDTAVVVQRRFRSLFDVIEGSAGEAVEAFEREGDCFRVISIVSAAVAVRADRDIPQVGGTVDAGGHCSGYGVDGREVAQVGVEEEFGILVCFVLFGGCPVVGDDGAALASVAGGGDKREEWERGG